MVNAAIEKLRSVTIRKAGDDDDGNDFNLSDFDPSVLDHQRPEEEGPDTLIATGNGIKER